MKPCSRNRKLIAWLATDALEADQARELHAHLQACPGCRRYLAEISAVKENLVKTEIVPDLEASPDFRRRWMGAVRSEQKGPNRETPAAFLRDIIPINWRVALPALAVTALVILVAPLFMRHANSPPSAQPGTQTAVTRPLETDLPPTIANYQMAASQSLEAFDDLLTRQGNRNLPPAPTDIAAFHVPANVAD